MKPATPLPWKPDLLDWRCITSPEGGLAVADVCGFKEDAAYIVHAANAYPKLVQALRECVDAADNDDLQSVNAGAKLLRELGENY